jgi:hypothetical protein
MFDDVQFDTSALADVQLQLRESNKFSISQDKIARGEHMIKAYYYWSESKTECHLLVDRATRRTILAQPSLTAIIRKDKKKL